MGEDGPPAIADDSKWVKMDHQLLLMTQKRKRPTKIDVGKVNIAWKRNSEKVLHTLYYGVAMATASTTTRTILLLLLYASGAVDILD